MLNEDELSHDQIQSIAKQEDITNPILSAKVVGNRVELHLLGGTVHTAQLAPTTGNASTKVTSHAPITPRDFLANLTVPQLRQLAALLNLNASTKLKKGQLVELMSPYPIQELKEAANKIQIV